MAPALSVQGASGQSITLQDVCHGNIIYVVAMHGGAVTAMTPKYVHDTSKGMPVVARCAQ
jgi:hypothetical protein